MYRNLVPRIPDNLRSWLESGAASRWVAAHAGQWDHQDWIVLLAHLGGIVPGNVEPDAVGLVLEALKAQWLNLSRWQASEEADRWVAACRGVWHHQDWLTLLITLRRSEFWPLDFEAVGLELEQARLRCASLRRWQESGELCRWVGAHQGQWHHHDWMLLLEGLRQSSFWPLNQAALGQLLESTAVQWRNLRRWQESGAPERWVKGHQGHWSHADWLALLGTFQWSGSWPVDAAAVGQVLEQIRAELFPARAAIQSGQKSLAFVRTESKNPSFRNRAA